MIVYLTPRQQNIIRIMADRREVESGETGGIWLGPEEIFEIVNEDGREPIEI